jgi:hypothetical protein
MNVDMEDRLASTLSGVHTQVKAGDRGIEFGDARTPSL